MDMNYIFGILGVALAIVGLIASFYFYRKSIRIKEPVYSIKSNNVISDYSSTYQNLTVSYKNERVENFTVSKVLFFNKGAETLNRDDIATMNRLRILANQGIILDTTVLQVNNPSSDFKVGLNRENNWIVVDFDYLNQHQGAVIEVIHTGLSSRGMEIVGDMKEVKGLIRIPSGLMKIVPPLDFRRSVAKGVAYVYAGFIAISLALITPNLFYDAFHSDSYSEVFLALSFSSGSLGYLS